MLEALSAWILGSSDLAPHGYCLLWEPGLIWLYAVSDGATALTLLITDDGLPGISGVQLTEAARAARPDLPILVITGYAGKSFQETKLAANIKVLRKPFTLEDLAAQVRGLLNSPVLPQRSG